MPLRGRDKSEGWQGTSAAAAAGAAPPTEGGPPPPALAVQHSPPVPPPPSPSHGPTGPASSVKRPIPLRGGAKSQGWWVISSPAAAGAATPTDGDPRQPALAVQPPPPPPSSRFFRARLARVKGDELDVSQKKQNNILKFLSHPFPKMCYSQIDSITFSTR